MAQIDGRETDSDASGESHRLGLEYPGIHRRKVGGDGRTERHMGENIPLQIYPGGDLDKLKAVAVDLEHRALRHEEGGAAFALREGAAVANLLDSLDELSAAALLDDRQLAVGAFHLEPARREGAAENHVTGILADVDENEMNTLCFSAGDHMEGINAFKEKRDAEFTR